LPDEHVDRRTLNQSVGYVHNPTMRQMRWIRVVHWAKLVLARERMYWNEVR